MPTPSRTPSRSRDVSQEASISLPTLTAVTRTSSLNVKNEDVEDRKGRQISPSEIDLLSEDEDEGVCFPLCPPADIHPRRTSVLPGSVDLDIEYFTLSPTTKNLCAIMSPECEETGIDDEQSVPPTPRYIHTPPNVESRPAHCTLAPTTNNLCDIMSPACENLEYCTLAPTT